jgi:tRNA threonylcarbamoyladenosine modification (KEOPS) complex Cgi121 subunit
MGKIVIERQGEWCQICIKVSTAEIIEAVRQSLPVFVSSVKVSEEEIAETEFKWEGND